MRDAVPMVNCGAVANAAVLKKRVGFLSLGLKFGLPTRFGRWRTKPANELLLVACVTVIGIPDWSERIVLTDQPPRTEFSIPLDAN